MRLEKSNRKLNGRTNSEQLSNIMFKYTHVIMQADSSSFYTVGHMNDKDELVSAFGGETFSSFLEELNKNEPDKYFIKPIKEAVELMDAHNDKMCGIIIEETEDEYNYALGCLPPEKFERVKSFSIFRMSEYYTDNITSHHINYGDRYFTAKYRTTTTYQSIASSVAGFMILNPK